MEPSDASQQPVVRDEGAFEISHLANPPEKNPPKTPRVQSEGGPMRLTDFFASAMVILGLLTVLRQLGLQLFAEWMGLDNYDSALYRGVGRGILNGLKPYIDLYESKPPGLFYLCAASQKYFGSFALERGAQIVALIVTFALLCLSIPSRPNKDPLSTLEKISVGAICAILTFYDALCVAGVQSECFGAAFTLGYLYCIAGKVRLSKVRAISAAAFIALAVAFKEPFFFAVFGGYLLLPSPKPNLIRGLIVPVFCAAVSDLLLLLATGNFDGYVNLYLPSIFQIRVALGTSLLYRSLDLKIILWSLGTVSRTLPILVPMGLIGLLLTSASGTRAVLKNLGEKLAGLWLLIFAVALGGTYWPHHFVCFIPAFFPLLQGVFTILARVRRLPDGYGKMAISACLLGIAFCGLGFNKGDPRRSARRIQVEMKASNHDAKIIDDILDRCHLARYLFFGGNGFQPFQYTKHSPLGPMFFQFGSYYFPKEGSIFSPMLMPMLEKADVIAFQELKVGYKKAEVLAEMYQSFDQKPPACAGNFPKPKKMRLLFRKSFAAEN